MYIDPDSIRESSFPSRSYPRRSYPRPAWHGVRVALRPPAGAVPALLEALVWLAAAVALRVVADTVLVVWPALWPAIALVLITPAIAAVWLSMWAPPLSLIVGYRLILIAIGLLLGGRL